MQVYSAAGTWARRPGLARWVMDPGWYKQVRAASEIGTGSRTDPDIWTPDPGDTLFGIPVSVRADGAEPHLEMISGPSVIDYYFDIAESLIRDILAPPPLGGLPDGTMLAVAPAPGKTPEEWRHAAPGAWIAHPHAAGAVHAEEMTAAQLRHLLAARDHG